MTGGTGMLYAVELGVDLAGYRQCVGEIGVFDTATEALVAGARLIGNPYGEIRDKPNFCRYYETKAPDAARIAGFTIERFDDDGTDGDWRIEGNAKVTTVAPPPQVQGVPA